MREPRGGHGRSSSLRLRRAVAPIALTVSILAPRMARAEGPGDGYSAASRDALGELGAPLVHIDSPTPGVILYRAVPSSPVEMVNGQLMRLVGDSGCLAPCDQVIESRGGEMFYFGGPRVTRSSKFSLSDLRGEVRFAVKPGNKVVHVIGIGLMGLGFASALVGATFLLVKPSHQQPHLNRPLVGGVLLGTGGALLGGGFGMWVGTGTSYKIVNTALGVLANGVAVRF